ADALGDDSTSARPAFHFRLPDCRIDEADWSLRGEWLRWLLVEEIAADEALLVKLLHGWEDAHGRVTLSRAPWARRCGEILKDAGVPARTIARDKTEDQENDEGEAA
ncbi:MAG: amidoligase family protein, partial [Pseudomonadota bacterium]|nr:amidoligase family protein [Pseudomonadota bacterium]